MTVSDGARDASGTIDAASAGELETVVHTYEGTQTDINSQSTGGNMNPERENVEGPGAPESKSGKANGEREDERRGPQRKNENKRSG